MPSVTPEALLRRLDRGERVTIVDVRTPAEFAAGHVPGAVNIPFQAITRRTATRPVDQDSEVVLYCGHGPRAWIAGAALRYAEFRKIVYLRGHWRAWRRGGLRTEP